MSAPPKFDGEPDESAFVIFPIKLNVFSLVFNSVLVCDIIVIFDRKDACIDAE